MSASYAVELVSVTKRFGEVVAVRDMTLRIPDGEFFSLLGPSGCGKTTTLRMIGGFEMPSRGEIFIGGEPQGYRPPYQRPVNTVFQSYALFPHMTVYENVAFGLEMRGVSREDIRRRVAEALDMVRLAGMERRRPSQLSGGQQQRVALARALINRPKVLLLDEPLGALDLKLRKAMQLELKQLQHRVGITFVYVTHDQEEALTMSDRIAVMNHGLVLQVGTAEEIYEHPNCRFVADFIGETNFLHGTIAGRRQGALEVTLDVGGTVLAQAGQDIGRGQPVTLAVRPERVRLSPGLPGGEVNALSGTVEDVVYTGVATTYWVALGQGERLMVRQQNEQIGAGPVAERGEKVTVSWPVDAASVFAQASEAQAQAAPEAGA